MTRLKDKWSKPIRTSPPILGDDPEFMALFKNREDLRFPTNPAYSVVHQFITHSRELILKRRGPDHNEVALVLEALDAKTLELVTQAGIMMHLSDETLKWCIALALIEETPFVGNTPRLQRIVLSFQEDVIRNGFTMLDEKKQPRIVTLTRYASMRQSNLPDLSRRVLQPRYVAQAEVKMLRDVAMRKLAELRSADRMLSMVESAVAGLEELLNTRGRNERPLQKCLVKHSVLFGVEYRRIIPHARLGGEYEMDYGLEKYDGTYDLVEIEPSSMPLFTKRGFPSSGLVHAEQQVLDWQQWVEENAPYARTRLPGVSEPRGYVVIGRRAQRSSERGKLGRRNKLYGGRLVVLTYDDLLDKCKALHAHLRGSIREDQP